jgi:hypothetical protein
MAEGPSMHRKGLATLTLLTVWEIWQERNATVFRNKLSPSFVLLDKIKNEARLWVLAGAKGLGNLMPGALPISLFCYFLVYSLINEMGKAFAPGFKKNKTLHYSTFTKFMSHFFRNGGSIQ